MICSNDTEMSLGLNAAFLDRSVNGMLQCYFGMFSERSETFKRMFSMNTEKRLRFMHHLNSYLFIDVWFVKTIFENLRMHKNHNIEKITFKVGHIKYSAMHINNLTVCGT